MRPLTQLELVGLVVVAFGMYLVLGVTIMQIPAPRWVSIDSPAPELVCWIHTGTRATVCFDPEAD